MKAYLMGLGIVLALLQVFQWRMDDDTPRENTDPTAAESSSAVPEHEWTDRLKIEQIQTDVRRRDLEDLANVRAQIDAARQESADFRGRILRDRKTQWDAILARHHDEHLHLVEKAKLSLDQRTDCTICGGDTYLEYCIFCDSDSNGLCMICGGKGQYFVNQMCPACMGSGKCFMCAGTRRMLCPFCDDGTLDLRIPPPLTTMKFN